LKNTLKIILFATVSAFAAAGCATKNAPVVKQVYHDLTGHYNLYFNANETYQLALKQIETNRLENYDTIIPLYGFGTLDDTKNQGSDFQRVIEKAELVVQTHQEKDKSKNYKKGQDNSITNWADDAFLIMAKAYYMMGEYDKAASCLRYITANFPDGVDARTKDQISKDKRNTKKRAKERKQEKEDIKLASKGVDVRPSKKLTVHEPAYSEALVWLAMTYTAQGNYTEAEAVFTHIKADRKFLKNYDREVDLAKAYYYISKGSVETAIPNLEHALESKAKKKDKARNQFVLAQLYQYTGNSSKAAHYYQESIKGNPNFDMAFYAKFNLIKMSRTGGYDRYQAERLLEKLLKDNKNREFRDQLYFEKALIALNDNRTENAKEMLKKSVEASVSNNVQKAKSYALLGDIYYEEENYHMSQAFYDSSLVFIEKNHKDYNFIYERSTVLTELVQHLNTIKTNDSILIIAAMPKKEMENFLYKLAVDLVEEEDKSNQQSLAGISSPASSGKGAKSAWYFYNENTRSSGFKKFQQRWGERPLEDNWRRADKRSGDLMSDEDAAPAKDNFFARVDAKYAELLANIPTSPEEKQGLIDNNIEAYYNAGLIYKSGLDNELKSIQTFEELSKKYPANIHEPEVFYYLYLLYESRSKSKSDRYKAQIIDKYPDSKFAKLLKDPHYFEKLKDQDKVIAEFYEVTFRMFGNEQYEAVIERIESAEELFPENPLLPKFDLLKALAIGGLKEYDPYVESLNYVIDKHKNTDEQAKASELLAYLKGDYPKPPKDIESSKFSKDKIDLIKNSMGGTKGDIQPGSLDLEERDDKKDGGVKFKFGEREFQLGGRENE
jgi:tetratricopeptide (TPR) repeat protein